MPGLPFCCVIRGASSPAARSLYAKAADDYLSHRFRLGGPKLERGEGEEEELRDQEKLEVKAVVISRVVVCRDLLLCWACQISHVKR